MVRAALWLLLIAGLGTGVYLLVREPLAPIEVRGVGTLPGETTRVDIGELRTSARHRRPDARRTRQMSYRIDLRNNLNRAVGITARLAETSSEDLEILLKGETRMLPKGSGRPILILLPPRALGEFRCRVVFTSAEIEGWRHEIEFFGVVVDGPQKGRFLYLEPASVNLGDVRPGDVRPFFATLRNEGDAEITISRWVVSDRSSVGLKGLAGGERIVPGGELSMSGSLKVPDTQGRWTAWIDVISDARNAKRRRFMVVGNVEPDFMVHPPRLRLGPVFPRRGREFTVSVLARPGLPPFVIRSVGNLSNLFEVVDLGGTEPAREKEIRLRVAKTAPPLAPVVDHLLRLVVDPPHTELSFALSMEPQPSIYASPPMVRFKTQKPGKTVRATILLSTEAGRTFKVTRCRSKLGLFEVEVVDTGHPPVQVQIRSVKGIGTGRKLDWILIETDDPDTPNLRVEVRIEYR